MYLCYLAVCLSRRHSWGEGWVGKGVLGSEGAVARTPHASRFEAPHAPSSVAEGVDGVENGVSSQRTMVSGGA